MNAQELIESGMIGGYREFLKKVSQQIKSSKIRVEKAEKYVHSINFSGEWLESARKEHSACEAVLESEISLSIGIEKKIKKSRYAFYEKYGEEKTINMIDIVYSDIPQSQRKIILASIRKKVANNTIKA